MNEHIDMCLNMGFLEAEQKGENVTPAFDFGSFAVSDDDTNAVFENCADCGILSRIDPSSGKDLWSSSGWKFYVNIFHNDILKDCALLAKAKVLAGGLRDREGRDSSVLIPILSRYVCNVRHIFGYYFPNPISFVLLMCRSSVHTRRVRSVKWRLRISLYMSQHLIRMIQTTNSLALSVS